MRAVLRIRKEPHYRRAAFEDGLRRVGFTLDDRLVKPSGPEDWLVIWNRQNLDEVHADAWEAAGGTVIVAENGYLQKVDKTHYAISVHGHNGSGWFPVGIEDRFSKLGFELKPWKDDRKVSGYVLIIGQRGIGSREMRSPVGWAEKEANWYKRAKLPYKLRPHPGNFKPKVPLELDLLGASLCLTWASAAGVRALVEGVMALHDAPHWICAPVSASGNDRGEALHKMAHGQWHHEEIATGEPFARIIEQRSTASW